jgi:hypothetical protein
MIAHILAIAKVLKYHHRSNKKYKKKTNKKS